MNPLRAEKLTADICPACGYPELETFYRLHDIPVNSCLLLEKAEQARDFPRANLELVICWQCGFITNAVFDVDKVTYAPQYEDQQSFSSTFNSFAESLARSLVEEFNLRDKDLMEVGCGKGDFLKLLCALGENRGSGIDPCIAPRQMNNGRGESIQWFAEFLDARHSCVPAEFYCCRHTLEHVPEVLNFMQLFREVIGERSAPLFIEVPDTTRVLADAAFEDIYYEHCSYFTRDSLVRLMKMAGFDTTRVYTAYADQYLLLNARTSEQKNIADLTADLNRQETEVIIKDFCEKVERKKKYWTQLIEHVGDKPIALWGSGSKCVSFLSSLDIATGGITVVDINPYRHGKFLPGSGLEVKSPTILRKIRPTVIIAMNSIYMAEIQLELDKLSVNGKLLGL